MSKKVRGPVRTHRRPGVRQTNDRRPGAPRTAPSQLEAAEIIAEDIVDERPAEAAQEIEAVARTVPNRTGGRTKPGSLLAVKAATEYVYVAQDMRRIFIVAGAMFGTLFVLYLALVIFRVIPLPFY